LSTAPLRKDILGEAVMAPLSNDLFHGGCVYPPRDEVIRASKIVIAFYGSNAEIEHSATGSLAVSKAVHKQRGPLREYQ